MNGCLIFMQAPSWAPGWKAKLNLRYSNSVKAKGGASGAEAVASDTAQELSLLDAARDIKLQVRWQQEAQATAALQAATGAGVATGGFLQPRTACWLLGAQALLRRGNLWRSQKALRSGEPLATRLVPFQV